jgi:hypothetical protein
MKLFLQTFVYIFTFVGLVVYAQPSPTQEVENYITDWAKLAPNVSRRAVAYVPLIIETAEKYELDPVLIAVIISLESSFDFNKIGKRGELGLMQVWGVCARGCDLQTPAGQIDCGCRCLRKSMDICGGDVAAGLNMYASGRCVPILRVTKYRMNKWLNAVKGRSQND